MYVVHGHQARPPTVAAIAPWQLLALQYPADGLHKPSPDLRPAYQYILAQHTAELHTLAGHSGGAGGVTMICRPMLH